MTKPCLLCRLTERPDSRWWCTRCDPEQRRTLPKRARRSCLAAGELDNAALRSLVETYSPECGEHWINRTTLYERAEDCDGCEHASPAGCGSVGLPFDKLLPRPGHRCPEGKWGTVCRIG